MNLNVEIPDDVAERLNAVGGDLSRRALEALVAEEYRQGHLTKSDVRRLLSLESSQDIDNFLKTHVLRIGHALQDLEGNLNRELPVLRLGATGALHRRDIYDDVS